MPGYVIIDPEGKPRTLWANGRGTTRELARDPRGAWRLSVADLRDAAPFSALPGTDRLFIVLTGTVRLTVNGRETSLSAGETSTFLGEDSVAAEASGPAQAVNVMVLRDEARIDVRREKAVREIAPPITQDEVVVLLDANRTVDDVPLSAGTALVPDGRPSAGAAVPVSVVEPSSVCRVRFHRLRRDC
jgi:environmental stress-induced protein Ves